MSQWGFLTKVPEQTLSVTASVTPLWTWTSFRLLSFVHFHIESPSTNTQAVTVTIRRSRFGTVANVDTQAVTISPGQEVDVRFGPEHGSNLYQGEAQSVSGTQSIHFIGEGVLT